jgi:hypothetical protein
MMQSSGFSRRFASLIASVLTALFACSEEAAADKIGGSNLPAATPPLKGRIAGDENATSVVVVGTSIGATTNAGPTLLETPSVFLDRAFGYAGFRDTAAGRVDVNVNLSDRHYTAFDDAYEQTVNAAASLTKDWAGQQTLVSLAFSKGRDVEERLMETSLSIAHTWTEGRIKPVFKAETALLDYGDVPGAFQPFSNQDDRDRISSRAQLGLRMTLTDNVEMEIGSGIDTKRYLDRYDDFGVRRDSISFFPMIGLAYTGERGLLRVLYMPFWRDYREELFRDSWKHGYAVEGEAKVTEQLKAFAAARYGFQETDFLVASSAYETVVLGGLALTVGKGTVSLAASETWRTYDDLDLIEVARADRKFEVALTGEMPLLETVSLNGRIGYLSYYSSFGDIGTDAWTASVGLTYSSTQ